MITIKNLTKIFALKSNTVLNEINFVANDGHITALLGPNGAGKTTLLRIIAGLETSTSGQIEIDQQSVIYGQPGSIAFISDGFGMYAKLTGIENIIFYAKLHGLTESEMQTRLSWLDEALSIRILFNKLTSAMSLGERMRIAIARALIHDPQTIILDEPMNGLDMEAVRKLRVFLIHMAHVRNKCIVITSHQMHEIERLADDIIIMSNGKIKAVGTVEELLEKTRQTDFEETFVQLAYNS